MIQIEEILKGIPEKQGFHKNTTTLKWKKDFLDFFIDKNLNKCLEIGTCDGITTKILSKTFNEIWSVEFNQKRINRAKEFCKNETNINFIWGDAYNDITYNNFPSLFDVAIIDCVHEYDNVMVDINRILNFFNGEKIYIAFDDYGHPQHPGVKQAIDDSISQGLKIEKFIGEEPGYTVTRSDNTTFTLTSKEGVILSYGI
jgi:ubiquinone/menaquinone biosynthesis C-methylase UbiE